MLADFANEKDSAGYSLFVSEQKVAMIVFAFNFSWYLVFVTGTIGQICRELDIRCLTLKEQLKTN